jgi:hypothetical protein
MTWESQPTLFCLKKTYNVFLNILIKPKIYYLVYFDYRTQYSFSKQIVYHWIDIQTRVQTKLDWQSSDLKVISNKSCIA